MNVEQLLAKFKRVKRSGAGWIALCPSHNDHSPSLSISASEDKILLHCHTGCSTESVCAAVGIEVGELFLEKKRSGFRVIAEYAYEDERGRLLYVVERRDPKDFRQRRPDGKGGWIWNLKGARRVLYRLPEVLAAQDVFICEGEKDCETARDLGLVATCNAGGAANKWLDEYSDCLLGKRIVIIADADPPGRKHAQEIAQSLTAKVERLKIAEFPQSKDLTEWVAAGGTRELLIAWLNDCIPEWKPKATIAGGFTLTPLGDLLARPDLPVDYVLENRLVAGTSSLLVAKPKVGKSTLARNLCLAVSRGEEFLGLRTKRGECIYLALEEREEDVRNDFRAMGAYGSEPIFIHAASAPAEGIWALCDLIRERRPALVVVDPLFRLAHIRDEKAYAETYSAIGPLIDAARTAGTHVLLNHHAGKSMKLDAIDSPLGSTAIGGAVATVLVMRRTEAYRTLQSVQRIGPDMPETVLEFDAEARRLSLGGTRSDADRKACESAILEFLAAAAEPQTQAQLRDGVEGQTRLIRAALTSLVGSAAIKKSGDGMKGNPFRYECWFAGSRDTLGTREPPSRNVSESRINTGDMLVPEQGRNPISVPRDEAASKISPFAEQR